MNTLKYGRLWQQNFLTFWVQEDVYNVHWELFGQIFRMTIIQLTVQHNERLSKYAIHQWLIRRRTGFPTVFSWNHCYYCFKKYSQIWPPLAVNFNSPWGMRGCVSGSYSEWQIFRMTIIQLTVQHNERLSKYDIHQWLIHCRTGFPTVFPWNHCYCCFKKNSQIWPPLAANFLYTCGWEVVYMGAIGNDKYSEWQ